MAKSRAKFTSPYADFDFEPFQVGEVQAFLESEEIDCDRTSRKHLYVADAGTPEADEADQDCPLAEAVTHQLNIAAQSFKNAAAEALRPTPKDTARHIQDAYKAGRKLTELVYGGLDHNDVPKLHPAIRRKLEDARAARNGERNPHLSLTSDLKAVVRLVADLSYAHDELGAPANVPDTPPTKADEALDGFVGELQRIWEGVLGRQAATSVGNMIDEKNAGKATGPFVRFMAWCVHRLPGHEKATAHALRNRFRRLRHEQAGKRA